MAWFDDLNLPGSTIDGYFGYVTADGPDEDDNPDVMLADGTVTFTATTAAARVNGSWLGIQPVTAQIFEGRLVVSEEYPQPIRLLATDANIGVADWAWKATFDIGGFKLNPLTFKAPADETVNLTAGIIPIASVPYQLVQGEPGESAYEVAVRDGYVGTEAEWLASLQGEPGASAWDAITGKPAVFPPATHRHDDRYYTRAEVDQAITAATAVTVVDARPWFIDTQTWLSATKLVTSGSAMQLTVSGRASGGAISNGTVVATVPAEYRPRAEVYGTGQNFGAGVATALTNGQITFPSVSDGAYFKTTFSWVR